MKKVAIIICFIWPLISSILGIQLLVGEFRILSNAEIVNYSNALLVLIGLFVIYKDIDTPSKTAGLWFIFYILFYGFGLLSVGLSNFDAPIARTLLTLIYFTSFYFFISNDANCLLFFKIFTFSLVVSAFTTLYLFKINYDFDYHGVVPWGVNRAGGLYADANNAALVSILAYFFFNYFFVPINKLQKGLKYFVLIIIFYSLVVTFSTTGLSTFIILFIINNHKFFKGFKLIIFGVVGLALYSSLFLIQSYTSQLNLTEAQTNKVNNLINVLTLNTNEVNNSGRGELMENFMINIYNSPVIGNGIDFSVVKRAHNTYLVVLGDAGILTFIFFIFVLVTYVVKSLKLKNRMRIFCFSIILTLCIFMISLQSVINQTYLIILFVFIGYVIDNPILFKKSQQDVNYD
ncbi:O-antigen ligase family protein [Algibacter mikhailovii]|uniref:O-antigen ligase family protein n=1 Tax=Algibacter mikhailovii TaxID=425498 RepID=UPI002494BC15|nr:hypothetical protein [Algibacter mikhailovii]